MTPEEFTHYTGIAVDQEHLWSILEGTDKVPNYNTSTLSKEDWCRRWKRHELLNYTSKLIQELYVHQSTIASLTRTNEVLERNSERVQSDRDFYKKLYCEAQVKLDKIQALF